VWSLIRTLGFTGLLVATSCSFKFDAVLIADGKPQEVQCHIKPDTDAPEFHQPLRLQTDMQVLKETVMNYVQNPAVELECDY
jgi:hypothetical protein